MKMISKIKINILFLETDIGFGKAHEKRLDKIIRNTAEEAVKIFNLKGNNLNFTVYPYNKNFTDGFTQALDWIRLSVPKKVNEIELEGVIYHEMCHIAMDYSYYSGRKTFLETLFAEGLAVVFETEQTKKIPSYARYNNDLLKKWLPELKKQNLSSFDFNYWEWFHGQGKKPKFLGYKLGRYLVEQIRKNFPDLTVSDLTRKKTKDLLKLANETILCLK